MPLQRNEFIPQSILTVYVSPSGMVDPRTGLPYQAGGLYPGVYLDLTEAEAQALSNNQCHEGRYRFVQIDSTATAANIKQGTIGFMKSLAKGVNFITDASNALTINTRQVVFLAPLTSAQVTAGAWVWVQEEGDATVLTKSALSNGSPAVGDIGNATNTGVVDDPTSQSWIASTIGTFTQAPTASQLVRIMLDLPVIQG